jgi:NADP-dependent aldehyde dehydrogenase
MKTELSGRHWIDGQWRAIGQPAFSAENPATGDSFSPMFFEADAKAVDDAMSAALLAFQSVAERDPRWPADLLESIASNIEDLGDELLERAELETALPRARLTGERARTCGQLRMFAQIVRDGSWVEAVIDLADPGRQPLPKPDLRRMFVPRGPVAIFGASNFPFAFGTCGGDMASALAAGNPVIVKGHPSHPGTSELFARAVASALEACKLPQGLFALLQGRGHELGALLVQHPATHAVGFTGSQRAGRALFDLASRRESPIPVYAEMGSINPVVILPSALRERSAAIAKELSASMLMGGGQFCTKPGAVFVVGDSNRQFVEVLAGEMQKAPQATMLNRSLRDSFADRTADMASVSGVKTAVAGKPMDYARQSPALFETSAEVFQREPRLRDEAFGPGGVVVECESVEDALACVDSLDGNLTGTVHIGSSEHKATAASVMRALQAKVGRVIVNGYPTGVEVGRAIVHGGPYPATTDSGTTSVGSAAIRRFVRLIAFQNTPQELLPPALRDDNPLGIIRVVNGERTSGPIESQT